MVAEAAKSSTTSTTGTAVLQPDLPPDTTIAGAGLSASCQGITVTAIQRLIDRISVAGDQADANVVANGPGVPGAGAPDSATVSADNVRKGQRRLTQLIEDLRKANLLSPSGELVNAVGGYAVYNRTREVILDLHHARHFAAVSAAWNSKRDPSGALACITSVTEILGDLEPFSIQATRCYLSIWYPIM